MIAFFVIDKSKKVKLFEKTFLIFDISWKIIFKLFFLNFSNDNINF